MKSLKSKIEDNNENICNLISVTVLYKIDLTVYGLHRDNQPAYILEKWIRDFFNPKNYFYQYFQ